MKTLFLFMVGVLLAFSANTYAADTESGGSESDQNASVEVTGTDASTVTGLDARNFVAGDGAVSLTNSTVDGAIEYGLDPASSVSGTSTTVSFRNVIDQCLQLSGNNPRLFLECMPESWSVSKAIDPATGATVIIVN